VVGAAVVLVVISAKAATAILVYLLFSEIFMINFLSKLCLVMVTTLKTIPVMVADIVNILSTKISFGKE